VQVSDEVKELFQYITRYKPQTIEMETKLKPFIPDYIPAIGEMDPFLKMPRPDGKADPLGLAVLDEPAAQQTDPTVLDLQLRAISTQAALQPIVIDSVDAAANPQKIETWMKNMKDLHDGNPAPKVDYSRAMPEMETLMQMWSPEMEEALAEADLPSAVLNVDTTAFARIVCAILDIPVYTSLTESLHLLFSLYSEFKHSNQDAMFPHLDPL
jgi:intraflagellar transport protein 46